MSETETVEYEARALPISSVKEQELQSEDSDDDNVKYVEYDYQLRFVEEKNYDVHQRRASISACNMIQKPPRPLILKTSQSACSLERLSEVDENQPLPSCAAVVAAAAESSWEVLCDEKGATESGKGSGEWEVLGAKPKDQPVVVVKCDEGAHLEAVQNGADNKKNRDSYVWYKVGNFNSDEELMWRKSSLTESLSEESLQGTAWFDLQYGRYYGEEEETDSTPEPPESSNDEEDWVLETQWDIML